MGDYVIRNVVVGTVKDGVTAEQVEAALQTMREFAIEGVDMFIRAGRDLGLRPGNASYVLNVDFADEAGYRAYDEDEEHNRIRREVFAPISESATRIQFAIG